MEHTTSNYHINAIKDVRKLFNELRSNLSSKETRTIRRKLYKKETSSMLFKEKEQDDTLTIRQKNVIKNIARYIKNISMYLKNFGKYLNKSQNINMAYIIYLMSTVKNILMHLKRLESFLMNVEVIFHIKKQMRLEKIFTKKKPFIIF